MQTVSNDFTTRTQSNMRQLYWRCLMSWLKDYDDGVSFFTIGESTIGGTDIIKGTGSVVQEWDKYAYDDYSSRVISFEYTREQDKLMGGAILSMADITLNNTDDYFTPGSGSAIDGYILPYRPIKLFAGFKDETVPVFIGLSEKMPEINEKSKLVEIHGIDFMREIFDTPLDEEVIYEDKRTDEIISGLLQTAGLTTSQFSLDTGHNIIDFAYFAKGTKLGDALRKLAQSEIGNVYMDEEGVIRFVSRTNWNDNTQVWHFDESSIIDMKVPKQDDLINVVEVYSNVREVLANQKYWELTSPVLVQAGGSVDIWADFDDPVTNVDEPAYITGATTSYYSTNYNEDGSGETGNTSITLSATSRFSTSYKMTFSNSDTRPIYITGIDLWATPAKVVNEIYVREENTTSIAKYGEVVATIENDFFSDEGTATSFAKILLADNDEYGDILEITVKGVPQLQIGDVVRVTNENINDTFYVRKIVGMMDGGFVQKLSLVNKQYESYFRIGISTIGSSDKIAP